MKITAIKANNRMKAFEVSFDGKPLSFPYSKCDPAPIQSDPIATVYVDDELGGEGFTYVLKSGAEGSVHADSVLEYNEDPRYLRDLLLYNLTVEAQQRMRDSRLSQNEVLRRAKTSASQLARLLDASNTTKSIDKMILLLAALDCEVELRVRPLAP